MKQLCPNCNVELFEDASEDIYFNEDGTITLDAYPALVCDSTCGYVKRMDDKQEIAELEAPNLFQFATSELSQ